MAMRDPKEWAARTVKEIRANWMEIDAKGQSPVFIFNADKLADLIREAQEDGARGARGKIFDAETWGDAFEIVDRMRLKAESERDAAEAQIAALTERAEKAEREANEWHELLGETADKLDSAEYERDEALKALDIHKERADRAESELHRRKF